MAALKWSAVKLHDPFHGGEHKMERVDRRAWRPTSSLLHGDNGVNGKWPRKYRHSAVVHN
jgi:hypothetical protein